MTNNIRVHHSGKTITITKAFERKASIVGSEEYKLLVSSRDENPEYEIVIKEIAKNSKKKSHARLTYKKMRDYISLTCGENSPALKEYERILKLSKTQSGCYSYVRKWFLGAFPNYDVTPVWHDLIDEDATSPSAQAEERVA